ncbi:ABC transporter substrate-binding protein [Paenibacillus sp. J5C_2022]|uniref:glycoside hydrolase family 31 protein n=1 Tax=Paenibacillus sp. J5C2022 TaxID=2977129 RepID=UPI0021CEE2BC|nr:TIM-barrel domain-containing protein [Paenibacillus sp. J5C2022]MCU6707517.1 ABC transporter substrate-binding protein [Paenibacillus sp. J5C2022]
MTTIQWEEAAPGVWRSTIGHPQTLSPLAFMGAEPRREQLRTMPHSEVPGLMDNIGAERLPCGGYMLELPLEEQEKLYGTGLQFMRMNQRGKTRYMRVNSDPKQDTGETHAPVPFYASDKGYGLLVDTSHIVTMFLGSTMKQEHTRTEDVRDRNRDKGWRATLPSSRIEIKLPAEGAHLYLFGGPALADVICRYNLYCGGGALPPRWGLGFWHRVPTLYRDEEVMEEALEFRRREFPCDVIGLEPGWHSRSYPVTYEWDGERFPQPEAFIREMKENGFRINLWEHPYVAPEGELYEKLSSLSGNYSVWGGLAPDYVMPEARTHYMKQHEKRHVALGVSGYKHDECDGSELTNNSWMFPAHARFPSGLNGETVRQLYGLMFQKMGDELFRKANRRTYGLVRASNAAASPMPYVLYSDLYDHKQFIRALCNASFSGLLWTPEVRRAQNAEDWIRRMQTVCFSPLAMLNAWGDGTKPWSFPEAEPVIRHYIQLRMRLLPYLYTAFAQYRETGLPPFRAMPLVMSEEERAAAEKRHAMKEVSVLNTTDAAYGRSAVNAWDDQYMVGDDLLIAPLVAGESERKVLLPSGSWLELETGERHEGRAVVQVRPGLERLPIYVREGAVIPMMPALSHVPASGEKVPLTFVHFGSKPGQCLIYDDDGESFDYESGNCKWRKVVVEMREDGSFQGELEDGNTPFHSYSGVQWQLGQTVLAKD